MKPLTPRQQVVLDFCRNYTDKHGYPPTMREIGQGVGLTNVSAVRGHLSALEKKGYISKGTDKARSIRLLQSPSVISRFKKKLHEIARTDKGVVHRIVYAVAVATRPGLEVFGPDGQAQVRDELQKRAVEHGWNLLSADIRANHLSVVVQVWPNHSPELVARRIKAAGTAVAKRSPEPPSGKSLWANGYAVTTDPSELGRLIEKFVSRPGGPEAEDS